MITMAELCQRGVTPAEAARLVTQEPVLVAIPAGTQPGELVEALVTSTTAFDEMGMTATLDRAFAHRLPAQVHDEIVSPTLVRVGELWERSVITLSHEHLLSNAVRSRLSERLRETLPRGVTRCAVLAAAEDDEHDLGLLGFALHVASWNVRPVVLGARVPPEALIAPVAQLRPLFVGISFVREVAPVVAESLLARYAAVLEGERWIVGGRAVAAIASIAERHGAIVAATLADAQGAALRS